MMQPGILGIEGFRHTLMPSVSYNYNPNFSDDVWGNYDTYTTPEGKIVRYDKYEEEIFGGVSEYESQNISFNVGNIFEMKMAKAPGDTTKEQKKYQLLNLDAGVAYNFAADSLKLSDLRIGYRTQIADLINFSGSSSYTFYDYEGGNKVNRFLASHGKGLFRLTNFGFSISTNLSGEKLKSEDQTKEPAENEEENLGVFSKSEYTSLYDDDRKADFSIPWNLGLSYNYNLSKVNPSVVNKYSNISADISFSLTKNWKFTVRGGYDFDRKEITAPQITVFRDLHCWEMNFTWNPLGFYNGYRFEIRMKAPELQDIKVTKSGGLFSGRR